MSANQESHGEDISMEDVEQPQELAPAVKKVYSRLPRVGAGREREHIRGLFNEPEYTVWDVYNNEAKKVDTELVNDWKESLNSLLLFAAIFAAVLTAFIIESKKMLEQDWGELLVNVAIFSIQHAGNLSSVSYIPPQFQATPVAVSINCILFASLGASLVAALLSVVALQWVVDYDAAITRGGSSPEDRAKRRQFRYAGVLNWKMGEIIAVLPLLLYSSVALFWAGAIQWMWSIHPTVGYVVAGGTALAVLLYASTTLMATIFVSAPFRTPLSRGIYWLCQPSFSLVHHKALPIRSTLLWLTRKISRILRPLQKLLAHSAFRRHVVQIAKWIQENLFPHITGSQREEVAANADESLGSQALYWLAGQLPISADSHGRLLLLISEILNHPPKQSLSSGAFKAPWWSIFDLLGWHYLQKALDGTLSEDDQEGLELLLQCREVPEIRSVILSVERSGVSSTTHRKQYSPDITKNRLKPAINATLLLERDVHKTLSLAFANPPYPDVRPAAVSALGRWAQNVEPRDAISASIPLIVELLKDEDNDVRSAAASALGKFAEQPELRDGLHVAVQPLLQLLKDEDNDVRSAAASALGKFAEQPEFRDTIHSAISSLIGLLKDGEWRTRSAAASALGKFAEQPELRDGLHVAVQPLLQLLKDGYSDVRSAAASALGKFAEQPELRDGLHVAVQPLLQLLKDEDNDVRSAAASALGKFAEQPEFRDTIHSAVSSLIGLLKDGEWWTRSAAASTLGKFAEQPELRDGLHVAVQPLLQLLKDEDNDVRSAAASALGKFAEQPEFRDTIHSAVSSLIGLLKDGEWWTRSAAASTLGKFAEQPELRDGLHVAVQPLLQLLKDGYSDVRSAAASALGKFAEQPELRDGLHVAVQPLLQLLKDGYSDVRSAAASALGKFAEQPELRDGLHVAVQPLLQLLKDEDNDVRSAAASALGKFAEQPEFRDTIHSAVSSLIGLLKDGEWWTRSAAASTLGKFAEQPELRDGLHVAVQPLLQLLKDGYSDVRSAAASALGKFAEQPEFRDAIRSAIPSCIELLNDNSWNRRVAALSGLAMLAKHMP